MDESIDDVDWDSGSWAVIQARSGQIEFDWFARDALGHIAVLSSFGTGPCPSAVRASRTRFNELLRAIAALPEDTTSHIEPTAGLKRTVDWEQYARSGLFAYDNAEVHGGRQVYNRIARPGAPVLFTNLPAIAGLADLVPVLPLVFSESLEIPFELIPA